MRTDGQTDKRTDEQRDNAKLIVVFAILRNAKNCYLKKYM